LKRCVLGHTNTVRWSILAFKVKSQGQNVIVSRGHQVTTISDQ